MKDILRWGECRGQSSLGTRKTHNEGYLPHPEHGAISPILLILFYDSRHLNQ